MATCFTRLARFALDRGALHRRGRPGLRVSGREAQGSRGLLGRTPRRLARAKFDSCSKSVRAARGSTANRLAYFRLVLEDARATAMLCGRGGCRSPGPQGRWLPRRCRRYHRAFRVCCCSIHRVPRELHCLILLISMAAPSGCSQQRQTTQNVVVFRCQNAASVPLSESKFRPLLDSFGGLAARCASCLRGGGSMARPAASFPGQIDSLELPREVSSKCHILVP